MAETPDRDPVPICLNLGDAENWIGCSGWLVSAKLSVTGMVQFFFPRAFDFTKPFTMSRSSGWNP